MIINTSTMNRRMFPLIRPSNILMKNLATDVNIKRVTINK